MRHELSRVSAAIGARAVFTRPQRLALLAALALLMMLRLPVAWAHGRFLDEEASVFLAYAWHRPWQEALFRPFAGYWNMAATAVTVLLVQLVRAGIVSLERAPYVTMMIALAVQLVPAVLLLTGRAAWLASRLSIVAALLFLAVLPATEEVFYNVLHCQFHLALAAAIILALDPPTGRVARIGYALLLVAAPLCGPGAIVLLPLFALRALIDHDARRLVQFAALAGGTAIQLLLFFGASPMRGHLLDPAPLAAALFVRLVTLPLLGFRTAFHFGVSVHASQAAGGWEWWLAAVAAVAVFAALLVVATRRRDAAVWLILSALLMAASSFGYGMVILHPFDLFSVGAGERYQIVPLVLLALSLIALARRYGPRRGFPAIFACVFMLVVGLRDYLHPLPDFADGPRWSNEAVAWRRDHAHPLMVWPRPWAADLSDLDRSCSPSPGRFGRSTDPRYCESGWVAGFYRPPSPPL